MNQAGNTVTFWQKAAKHRAWIYMLFVVGLITLGLFGLLLWDDQFYVSQDQPNTRAFAANAVTETDSAAVVKNIEVWVDTNPNMYGFVNSTVNGCVPSAYRAILLNLSGYLKGYALSTGEHYHYFNKNRQGSMEESDEILEKSYYLSIPTAADDANRMVSILAAQTGDTPALFFTDFESFNSKQFQAALKTVAKQLFDQGKSIRVDAYRSAY